MDQDHKKRILVFLPSFPVRSETFIARDLSALVELGHLDITVLAIKRGNGELPKNLESVFKPKRLNIFDQFFGMFYLLTRTKNVKNGYKILMKDKSRGFVSKVYLFIKSLGYTKVFSRYNPQEIHAHFMSEPSTIGLVASKILNIPISINAHARDVLEYPSLPVVKSKESKFVTICNSRVYDYYINMPGVMKDNVHLIHHGLDSAKIFSSPLNIEKPQKPMIFMGGSRLTDKKGIEYAIRASKLLVERGFNHQFDLIGPGDNYKKYIDLIKEVGVENNFFIHGDGKGAPFSEISQYYRIADIFVLPIVTMESGDSDGIPNTIIEASLAGLPVVTTDAGSVTELIQHEVTGLVVPQRNVSELTLAIQKLLVDQDLRSKLGTAAKQKATEMFEISKTVKQLENLLLS